MRNLRIVVLTTLIAIVLALQPFIENRINENECRDHASQLNVGYIFEDGTCKLLDLNS